MFRTVSTPPLFTTSPSHLRTLARAIALCAAAASLAAQAQVPMQPDSAASGASDASDASSVAASPTVWELSVSPYTLHWSDDPEHRRVGLVGLERHRRADGSLWGLSLFANSFGQPSAYAYYGHQWDALGGNEALYAKVSVGVLYGYTGAYADKVPLNYKGFSPALIPAVGLRLTPRDAVQAAVLGNAGLLFSYNRRF